MMPRFGIMSLMKYTATRVVGGGGCLCLSAPAIATPVSESSDHAQEKDRKRWNRWESCFEGCEEGQSSSEGGKKGNKEGEAHYW